MLALVTGIADLGYILNLAWGEVSRIELTASDAEIAFTTVTAHIQTRNDRCGYRGGHL